MRLLPLATSTIWRRRFALLAVITKAAGWPGGALALLAVIMKGGLVAWWPGGLVAWWPGGLVAWWPGGLVAWWPGGPAARRPAWWPWRHWRHWRLGSAARFLLLSRGGRVRRAARAPAQAVPLTWVTRGDGEGRA